MLAQRIVPVALLGCLALAIVVAWAKGKDDVTLSGVVVEANGSLEFYADATGCDPTGAAYLVIPNENFGDYFRLSMDYTLLLRQLPHANWKAKLRGNLSHVGRFGRKGRDAREFTVISVVDSVELDCGTSSAPGQSPATNR
jgi:hypothetical protein